MGLDVEHDVYHQRRLKEKAEARIPKNKRKAQRIEIGKRHGKIALLGNKLAGRDASPEKKQILGEYADVLMVRRQRDLGYTAFQVRTDIIEFNKFAPQAFEASAMNLHNYRRHFTEGEGAISVEIPARTKRKSETSITGFI